MIQIKQPLIAQILESLFDDLSAQDIFPGPLVSDLKRLAQEGSLSKPDKVIDVIKAASGDKYEVA